ncbi:MAG: dienelactone hydrolase family protein [Candidatus Eremiobacterota bacterium]
MYERSFPLCTATGTVPALAMASRSQGPYPGTVLVYHGLRANKETQRKELEQLAARGFLAVALDGVAHGQRAVADLAAHMEPDPHARFLGLVAAMLAELPAVIDALQGLEAIGAVGVAGISMGGYVAFGAPGADPRVRASVPILGSPDWGEVPPELVGRIPRQESFAGVGLLAWNAGRDVNVPPHAARSFVRSLPSDYDAEYVEYPESDHFMRPEDWEDGWARTLDFLSARLPTWA